MQLSHRHIGIICAKGAGAQPGFVGVGEVHLSVQRFVALAVQTEEYVDLFLIHDQIFHAGGDAVLALFQRNGLHILIFHRIGKGTGKGHRLSQLPQAGHLGAGVGHRRAEVHQYHK